MTEPKPTFLVVGAGRSGTTTIHSVLAQHPDVFVPDVKAPSHFYCPDAKGSLKPWYVPDPDRYAALFRGAGGATARGEVSPAYLCSPRVPDRIVAHLPDVKVIAILRNPVDRLFARYVARRRDGLENAPDLRSLLNTELARPPDLSATADTYFAAGFVSHVLSRYIGLLGRERVSLHLFDDFRADPASMRRALFSFIGVAPEAALPEIPRANASGGEIANPLVRSLWTGSAGIRARVRPMVPRRLRDQAHRVVTRDVREVPFPDELRLRLTQAYAEEIDALAALLGRDLRHWREERTVA